MVGCCTSQQNTAIEQARALICEGKAECVLVKDGRIIKQQSGRGVSPLLSLYESVPESFEGATVVDKVIGRAAASIVILGKAQHVHGEIMSEDAVTYLQSHGITTSQTQLVPRILNRKRDGLCPLEQSVQGIDHPADALVALKQRIKEIMRPKQ